MEKKPYLFKTVQHYKSEEAKALLLILIKNLISQHKTPWEMTKRENSASFAIRDAWGKVVINFAPEQLAEQIIATAKAIVKGHESDEKEYSKLLSLWEEADNKYRSIDRALEKEEENDFRNMILT